MNKVNVNKVVDYVKLLKENERLTELCNKYEEEHKTTFETWQKDIKENELLHSIIKEVRKYIDNDFNRFDCFGSMAVSMEMNYKREELLEILDKVGVNNE